MLVQSFSYELCQLGKHHRATYKRWSLSTTQSRFKLIHCDIWDLDRVSSDLGFRYYIVFINNYSRMSWVHLLKDRLHVFDVVKKLFAEKISHLLLLQILFVLIMYWNLFKMIFKVIVHPWVFFIRPIVHIHLSKMVWLRKNTDIFWTWLAPLCCRCKCQNIYSLMLFLLLYTLLVECHPLTWKEVPLRQLCRIRSCFLYLLEYLIVLPVFKISL